MEEKMKQNLEFIEPEVKVVVISGKARLCQTSKEADAESYDKVYTF